MIYSISAMDVKWLMGNPKISAKHPSINLLDTLSLKDHATEVSCINLFIFVASM
jgi:hypothetical protein